MGGVLSGYLKADLGRLISVNKKNFVKFFLFNLTYKVCFWFRVGCYLHGDYGYPIMPGILRKMIYPIVFLIQKHYQEKSGIQIRIGTNVGKGLCFTHYSAIIISPFSKIGENVTIFQGVTVGGMFGKGDPVIGDNVIAFAGSKIIGNVQVGNNVVIGANAVVSKDIPDNAVVVGVPAKVINYNGAEISSLYRRIIN